LLTKICLIEQTIKRKNSIRPPTVGELKVK
jgi:hypothetical protein